jgi:hypothetical protein
VAANHYDLTFLESTNNIRAHAKRAFGREPNAKVGRDISVSIQQGRLFFEAAEPAPLQIRPLLVYYGVLSFSRALTAAIKNVEISDLEHSHGLKDVGNPTSIEDLRLTLQESGTFQEFNNALAPLARYYYFHHSMRKSVPNPFQTAEGLIGQEVSIVDVLSRIPALHRTFARTFSHQTKCVMMTHYTPQDIRTTLRIDDPFLATDREKLVELITRLRADYPFLKNWRLDNVQIAWDNSILEFDNARFDYDDISPDIIKQLFDGNFQCISTAHQHFAEPISILPPMAGGFDKNAYSWAIQPIGGVILSEYSLQFLGTFLLGSLVRYRPQIWQHALSKSATQQWPADDRSLSLIEQFIDGVLDSFPKLVVNLLESSSTY